MSLRPQYSECIGARIASCLCLASEAHLQLPPDFEMVIEWDSSSISKDVDSCRCWRESLTLLISTNVTLVVPLLKQQLLSSSYPGVRTTSAVAKMGPVIHHR